MGWGRFLLLGDLGQQLDLADREREMVELRERIHDQHAARATLAKARRSTRCDRRTGEEIDVE